MPPLTNEQLQERISELGRRVGALEQAHRNMSLDRAAILEELAAVKLQLSGLHARNEFQTAEIGDLAQTIGRLMASQAEVLENQNRAATERRTNTELLQEIARVMPSKRAMAILWLVGSVLSSLAAKLLHL